jgi:hypothetical protein
VIQAMSTSPFWNEQLDLNEALLDVLTGLVAFKVGRFMQWCLTVMRVTHVGQFYHLWNLIDIHWDHEEGQHKSLMPLPLRHTVAASDVSSPATSEPREPSPVSRSP